MDELGKAPDVTGLMPNGTKSNWPNHRKFPLTRRLFAYYRWLNEGNVSATLNVRASITTTAPQVFE